MTAEPLGSRLLGEIETGKLDDILRSLQKAHNSSTGHGQKPLRLGLPALDLLWTQHNKQYNSNSKLEITGPGGLPLLYHIVSAAVAAPRHGTIAVVDTDGRFDVSRLTCSFGELQHVHVFRPVSGRAGVLECLKEVERFLADGDHWSWDRECVGTVVNGAQDGDLIVGWRGWLTAESERSGVSGFGAGISVEEALEAREERMRAVEGQKWRARCEWGDYQWQDC